MASSSAQFFCHGCRKQFSFVGLSHHLSQTKKRKCLAYRSQSLDIATSSNSAGPSTLAPHPHPPVEHAPLVPEVEDLPMDDEEHPPAADLPPNIFHGDYFGTNYTELDFPWDDEDDADAAAAEHPTQDFRDEDSDDDIETMPLPTEYTEPPPHPPRPAVTMEEVLDKDEHPGVDNDSLWCETTVVHFGGRAGEAIGQNQGAHNKYEDSLRGGRSDGELNDTGGGENEDGLPIWHPFASKMDWEVARWAKLRGPSSTALSELLSIEGLRDLLGLSFKTAKELNSVVNEQLPGTRPEFKRGEIIIDGVSHDIYYRDIMECIKSLYSDPNFAEHLVFAPERHYADPDQTIPMYNEMNTGKWWWRTQIKLETKRPGATIIPIIISSDKTQLTLFRNRSAYPVYLTIGNIPKGIRRKPGQHAQILLGYLPTTRLSHIKDAQTRRLALSNLFHAALRTILHPLKKAGRHGVELASGDSVVRRCHPIFAVFVGDYPEQCLVVCCKQGDCPKKCILHDGDLGKDFEPEQRSLEDMLAALSSIDRGPVEFVNACEAVDMKPIPHPFWEDLPHADPFLAITPDVLHQLYQGMVKHIIEWIKDAFGEAEIDARFARLPPNHNLRHFSQGISILSRVSGEEHKDICRVLLGVVIDLRLPEGRSPVCLVRALRALLDFVYLAQYPCHTSTTLGYLKDALKRFHSNKSIFVELGIHKDFELPKLHSLYHYVPSIAEFGTTDNYSTESTERLHIDFAKDAYRATNHKDEYPQMTAWLTRREKILRNEAFIHWRMAGRPTLLEAGPDRIPCHIRLHITRFPSDKSVSFTKASALYGAAELEVLLRWFIVRTNNPNLSTAQVKQLASGLFLPFKTVAAFHKIKFWNSDAQGRSNVPDTMDAIHVRPAYRDTLARLRGGRFNTALVNLGDGDITGVTGYHVAQVRLVFALSKKAQKSCFAPHIVPPSHLAYIEWFTPFDSTAAENHLMYPVRRAYTVQRPHLWQSFTIQGSHLSDMAGSFGLSKSPIIYRRPSPNGGDTSPMLAPDSTTMLFDQCGDTFDYRTSNQSELMGAVGMERSQQNTFQDSYPSLHDPRPLSPRLTQPNVQPGRRSAHAALQLVHDQSPFIRGLPFFLRELHLKPRYPRIRVLKARNLVRVMLRGGGGNNGAPFWHPPMLLPTHSPHFIHPPMLPQTTEESPMDFLHPPMLPSDDALLGVSSSADDAPRGGHEPAAAPADVPERLEQWRGEDQSGGGGGSF
ncbi:hypothetical protein OF83DRAFT_1177336 [Amylostereum chailletii]|nr:hypothetical protein OF83DRAFT_1177336 [Amylostereum chailletii]